jgi:hypothetical protein
MRTLSSQLKDNVAPNKRFDSLVVELSNMNLWIQKHI